MGRSRSAALGLASGQTVPCPELWTQPKKKVRWNPSMGVLCEAVGLGAKMEIRVDIWNKLKLQRGLRGARLRLLRPTDPAPSTRAKSSSRSGLISRQAAEKCLVALRKGGL